MFKKATFFGTLAGLGFLLGAISGAIASETHSEHSPVKNTQFQRIEQPLSNKILVTVGGLGLIGLELWWFLLSKPKSQKAVAGNTGIQEVTVTVDGGYEPSRIVVQAGQPVRLNFLRRDPSSCLEQVLIPDFHIAADLQLNEVTSVEFTPKAGNYIFTCGMNMFRGEIIAEAQQTELTVSKSSTSGQYDRINVEAQTMQPTLQNGTQKITINVNKGYTPNQVSVKAGQPVQLNFLRENPSGCLAKVLIPDFEIAADLPLNDVTTIEFTPEEIGEHSFTCGMNMFRGVIKVEAAHASNTN